MYVCVCVCVCMYAYKHECMYVCVYVCVCVHVSGVASFTHIRTCVLEKSGDFFIFSVIINHQ